jgi:hypothetical protein
VRKLISELVAEELNGHADPDTAGSTLAAAMAVATPERAEEAPEAVEAIPGHGETGEALRRCSTCRTEMPASKFSPGHYVCRECRRPQERDRARRRAAAQRGNGNGKPEPEG